MMISLQFQSSSWGCKVRSIAEVHSLVASLPESRSARDLDRQTSLETAPPRKTPPARPTHASLLQSLFPKSATGPNKNERCWRAAADNSRGSSRPRRPRVPKRPASCNSKSGRFRPRRPRNMRLRLPVVEKRKRCASHRVLGRVERTI